MYKRPRFLTLLDQRFARGSDPWYELFFRDELAELRKRMGVEGPRDIANRADLSVWESISYGQSCRRQQQIDDNDLLVHIAITYSAVGLCFARLVLNHQMEIHDMNYLDTIAIAVDARGRGSTSFGDRALPVSHIF